MSTQQKALTVVASVVLMFPLAGCGSSCFFGALSVSPPNATADHAAAPPGNQQRFLAFGTDLPPGCAAIASNLPNVTWSVSDQSKVGISNAQDQTFGVATCLGTTTAPVTVTATLPPGLNNGRNATGTATLTCK